MNQSDKIYIAGHRGMVGSAIMRRLESEGYSNIITRTSKELDLRNQQAVTDFFAQEKPEMADAMRSNGKIYVVVAVCLTILIGLFIYVFLIDRKISKLEKEV